MRARFTAIAIAFTLSCCTPVNVEVPSHPGIAVRYLRIAPSPDVACGVLGAMPAVGKVPPLIGDSADGAQLLEFEDPGSFDPSKPLTVARIPFAPHVAKKLGERLAPPRRAWILRGDHLEESTAPLPKDLYALRGNTCETKVAELCGNESARCPQIETKSYEIPEISERRHFAFPVGDEVLIGVHGKLFWLDETGTREGPSGLFAGGSDGWVVDFSDCLFRADNSGLTKMGCLEPSLYYPSIAASPDDNDDVMILREDALIRFHAMQPTVVVRLPAGAMGPFGLLHLGSEEALISWFDTAFNAAWVRGGALISLNVDGPVLFADSSEHGPLVLTGSALGNRWGVRRFDIEASRASGAPVIETLMDDVAYNALAAVDTNHGLLIAQGFGELVFYPSENCPRESIPLVPHALSRFGEDVVVTSQHIPTLNGGQRTPPRIYVFSPRYPQLECAEH